MKQDRDTGYGVPVLIPRIHMIATPSYLNINFYGAGVLTSGSRRDRMNDIEYCYVSDPTAPEASSTGKGNVYGTQDWLVLTFRSAQVMWVAIAAALVL